MKRIIKKYYLQKVHKNDPYGVFTPFYCDFGLSADLAGVFLI